VPFVLATLSLFATPGVPLGAARRRSSRLPARRISAHLRCLSPEHHGAGGGGRSARYPGRATRAPAAVRAGSRPQRADEREDAGEASSLSDAERHAVAAYVSGRGFGAPVLAAESAETNLCTDQLS